MQIEREQLPGNIRVGENLVQEAADIAFVRPERITVQPLDVGRGCLKGCERVEITSGGKFRVSDFISLRGKRKRGK